LYSGSPVHVPVRRLSPAGCGWYQIACNPICVLYLSSGSAVMGFVKETAYTPGKHGQEGLFLSGVDASFATGQRFNAFHLSEAMRSATA
jgi:hypothetical protein